MHEKSPAEEVHTLPQEESIEPPSTPELLRDIFVQGSQLVRKEVELAVAETRATVQSEVRMVKRLAVAAVCAYFAAALLLATLVLAISEALPAWASALIVGLLLVAAAVVAAIVGTRTSVPRPLERTRRTLKEDVIWAKKRLA